MSTFAETQRFRQWWVWAVMGFILVFMLSEVYVTNAWNKPASLFESLLAILPVLLLYVWRLDTRLDVAGIHYRVFPFIRWRTIQWTSIRSAAVQEYGFVGYGIRWGIEGWVYNIAGRQGLRITFLDKRQLTIGTQRPDEMQAFLANHSTLTTA